jgi:predicted unusual protein kinase regulating ubiquinone biosynthesis (AarF/ABC1/UbiB family)
MQWMHEEIEGNLRKELDFENEARNAERSARNFAGNSSIHIPTIVWPLTSKRVLCMEFIDGCRISEQPKIAAMGFPIAGICDTAVRALADMIFLHGFVHCDPHPGNLLVRPNPSNPSQHQVWSVFELRLTSFGVGKSQSMCDDFI